MQACVGSEWFAHCVFLLSFQPWEGPWVGPPHAVCGAQPWHWRRCRHKEPSPQSRWPSGKCQTGAQKGRGALHLWAAQPGCCPEDCFLDAAKQVRRDPCFRVNGDNRPYVRTFQYVQNRAYAQARSKESHLVGQASGRKGLNSPLIPWSRPLPDGRPKPPELL